MTEIERNGKIIDIYETPFGVRSTKFDAEKGFLLNGERLYLQGVCDHHDLGALGSAINYRALERQLEILKEMGVNAIRTSHNPPAPELLELADKMGFVVMDEAFDEWAKAKKKQRLQQSFQRLAREGLAFANSARPQSSVGDFMVNRQRNLGTGFARRS